MENFVPGVFIKIINKSFILLKCINTWCTLTGWTEYMVYSVIAVLAKTNHFWSFIQCTYQNIVIGYTYSCRWCWKHMWHRNEQIEHLHWTLWTKTHIFKLVKNLIPQSWSVLKSSHRMKPGKGLAPHGTSYGADHPSSLVTPWVPSSYKIEASLNTSHTVPHQLAPSVLELSSTNSRQFPLAPGAAAPLNSRWPRRSRDPGSDWSRDRRAGLSLVGSKLLGALIGWERQMLLWERRRRRSTCPRHFMGTCFKFGQCGFYEFDAYCNWPNNCKLIVKTKFIHDSWNAFELTNVFLWYRQAFALD